MNTLRLILRNLLYYRGVNLAVIAGVAVATAVLSGALMVGDSVRGSLTELAVRRLGKLDHALLSGRFFDASLVERLTEDASIKGRYELAPAVIVRGGAMLDSGGARTAGVQVIALGGDWVSVKPGEVILNGETADALGITAAGVDIVLSVPTESDIPLDATLAKRSRQDTLTGMRVRVVQIIREPGMIALFSSGGSQRAPQNAWVNLADLQDAVGRRGRINTIVAHQTDGPIDDSSDMNAVLRRLVKLSDYGLIASPVQDGAQVAVTSDATYLGGPVDLAADQVAQQSNIGLQRISVNLLNSVHRIVEGQQGSVIHYAVAAGISPLGDGVLADDEVALNQWAAEHLGAAVGDRIALAFYRRQSDGALVEVSDTDRGFTGHFRIARILPMTGIGADASLTPIYKGLTDADTIASWDPPDEVKIDKSSVTPADEAYWKQYKAAPKLFFSYGTSQRLWGEMFGNLTSIRVPTDRADEFTTKLLATLNPAAMGLFFQPLRQQQLAAAGGTTDFGQLFIGFSFFLIIAAALLVAMLMRLGVEQRGRQLGAMSAVGFAPSALCKIMLIEGMILAMIGGVIGLFLAVGYTWLMMAGLRTWWVGAMGTTAMQLYVEPPTLVIGFIIAQIVALMAILWAVKQVGRASPARLLAGGWEAARPPRATRGGLSRLLGVLGLVVGIGIIVVGVLGSLAQQIAFILGGAILLGSSLLLVGGLLQPGRRRSVVTSIPGLGMRNATRHPSRSVLCVSLLALAAFALVTVSSMRQGEPSDTGDPRSGAGGYRLIVESEIPLRGNPGTVQGRELLGIRQPSNELWQRVEFLPMRLRPGQDVSCLNLTRATSPAILGVPSSLIEKGGFVSGDRNPWALLREPDSQGAIPILADDSTAKYIMHLGIGETLDVADEAGQERKLRLVGTLPHTIFQSQLLMSEDNFRAMYPAQSGFGLVLVKVNPEDREGVRTLLSEELSEFGATVRTTASMLAGFLEVQNTYLSTFELLGALGLMLGTVGLAVVLIRTVIERESELALLASLGFSSGSRVRLVLSENTFLLVLGMLLGTGCALIGVLPALVDSSRGINVTSLAVTLAGALLFGLCASGLAVWIVGGRATVADLRRE